MSSPTIILALLILTLWSQISLGQDNSTKPRCGLDSKNVKTLDTLESIIETKFDLIRKLIDESRRDVTKDKAKAYNQGQIYNLLFLGAWIIEIVGDWVTNNRTFDNFNGQEDMVLSNYGMTMTLGIADQASAIFGGLPNPADTRNCFFVEDFIKISDAFKGVRLRTCDKSFDDRASDFEFIIKAKMSCVLDSLEDSSAELRWILDEFLTGVSLRNQLLDEAEPNEEDSEQSEEDESEENGDESKQNDQKDGDDDDDLP